ncbi:MAG TPA: non-ribosomal peptide synthetase, partial [Mycobacterium sp.]|nr:non-ribosomal peptide synthetase [Mycobacterium sp.]
CTAVPYGVPFPNIACRVVDNYGADSPDWVAGELWISGRGNARGYRGRSDLTAERFVRRDDRIWYRTGDLARYRPDGTLEFVGRADYRIKISGYRVELGEMEASLRRVPGVRAAVAALVPAPGGAEVLAAQVCCEDPALDARRIREAYADLVPAHMIPRHISVVDRIPFTDGGKIDRRAVARQLAAAVSGPGHPGHRVPSTALESALAEIIGGLLQLPGPIGVDDDFFALGGDSVLATQAVARIRTWLDTPDLMVADIFATRTVSVLAALLGGSEHDTGRLDQVAQLYLEVVHMDADAVLSATSKSDMAQ